MAARHVVPSGQHRHVHLAVRLIRGVLAGVLLVLLSMGIPWGLWRYVGWPLPNHAPTGEEISNVLTSPMSASLLLNALACLLWTTWALFAVDVLRTAGEAARGTMWAPRGPGAGPVHGLAAALIGAVVLALLPYRGSQPAAAYRDSATVDLSAMDARTAAPDQQADVRAKPLVPRGGKTVEVRPPHHGVHDSLWRIAQRHLGDGDRWLEIYALNHGRPQPDGRTLAHPCLIRPGWVLRLPDTGTGPDASRPPDDAPEPPPPTPPPSPDPPPHRPPPHEQDGEEPGIGLDLPSGAFVGVGLAAAVAAAAAVVLRRRRIRYRPGCGERGDVHLAPVVRALRAASEDLRPQEEADSPSSTTTVLPAGEEAEAGRAEASRQHPAASHDRRVIGVKEGQAVAWDLARSRGLGLTGPGLLDAARALLIHYLAEMHTAAPGADVLITHSDAQRLLGTYAVRNTQLPRLHVTADTTEALAVLEAEVLSRTRMGEEDAEHSNLDQQPTELVFLGTPSPEEEHRLQAVLDNGSSVGVCGILLGQWRPGRTLRVEADGTVVPVSPSRTEAFAGTRLFTLPAADARTLLDLLAEAATASAQAKEDTPAHAAERLPASSSGGPEAGIRAPSVSTAAPTPPATQPLRAQGGRPGRSSSHEHRALRLVVFGHVRVTYQPPGADNPVEVTHALAPKQREVLAYLALHRTEPGGTR
ncbi:hypothetical protein GCM10018785_11950 [Streptomyces longispororuber]|uniref:LysM domain-containing protein n=1 Tax=Streptomyces longispororuber TaxID=68230 RepID=A0A918ZDA9_9ACTN|nr:LysM peptidoglycan-binding domain-containing protein [Streptomyces longispororuber]GHE43984.1 hypothetical protein GCM10018785_11950 [Streptomyces longispororuber]